ncbi:NUDIX domain-containing protein [Shimia aestuarii]|uniref:NUDIX domain-containing protein n=1 Tax=Shimia aestuarii TaxID=254406 RepID=UPI001FB46413|nr:NUDIX domain-containing protein [Shimia aestuarii]
MTSLFFYGTLRHVPLLSIVLGRPAEEIALWPAMLEGHAVHAVVGESFPMLVEGGDGARGLFVEGLSAEDLTRLRFYEGGFDYDVETRVVATESGPREADVFIPPNGLRADPKLWRLDAWVAEWGEMTLHAAREVMSYYGEASAQDVARRFAMIRARAAAKVNARQGARGHSPCGFTDNDVEVANVTRAYVDFFALDEYDLRFRQYAGGQSETVKRAVFVATDAVIVLPYDPVRDRVLLVEQFRSGPFGRGDPRPWQLEPIAGRIDAGETAEATAHREAAEEAGLTLRTLHDVAHCYASPGCSTEFFDIFVGIADLPDDVVGVSGLESEQEDIRSYLFSYDALMELVDRFEAVNAPLVLAALWLARHRERLRETA